MVKKITIMLVLLLVAALSIGALTGGEITIASLIENEKALDGKTVTIKGEVIGEVLERGDYAWINVNDTTNAIGIWLKRSDTAALTTFGDYKHTGDVVRVTGVFRRACEEHGGEPDIHADTTTVVHKGGSVTESVAPSKIIAAAVLSVPAAALGLIYYRMLRRRRKNS